MLDRVPGFFSRCTGVIIVYAVICDRTYFQVVGAVFYKTYTLSDHITSELERLPLAGFGFFLGLLISLVVSK